MIVLYKKAFLLLVLALFSTSSICASRSIASLESFNAHYQSLLDDVVTSGQKNGVALNLVDYGALRSDERLDNLMLFLAEYDYNNLPNKSDRIAYFLNAYNVMAINMVADNWPIESLRGLGNMFRPVWTHQCGTLNHEHMTLRVLEHDLLRQQSEPRIHFALNCASVSCPDLRKEPYVGERLDAQLDDQTNTFFAQIGKGSRLDASGLDGGKLWVSPLMDWFEEDFEVVDGVEAFLQRYLPTDFSSNNAGASLEIEGYLDYDWDVNAHLNLIEKRRAKEK